MFDNLEDQIKITEGGQSRKTTEKVMRFAGIVILSATVFGGLCAIILALECWASRDSGGCTTLDFRRWKPAHFAGAKK